MLTHSPRNPNIFHQNISLTINLFKIFCKNLHNLLRLSSIYITNKQRSLPDEDNLQIMFLVLTKRVPGSKDRL